MILGLMALFITVPLVELAILLRLGRAIGFLPSLAVVVITGIIGAALARREGLKVLVRIRDDLAAQVEPSESILDGVCVLAAGLMLVTPGILTDACGFALLIPQVRGILRRRIMREFAGRFTHVHISTGPTFVDVAGTSCDANEPDEDETNPPKLDPMLEEPRGPQTT